ncbi:MAG: Gfo/Idh/MocA family oxidoreductase [Cyclobacteriaceae bacterium]|nr:Gfo/Idh/MocA family oxidoreductase [Cyclobacteriaceae bacterium]
MQRREFIIKSTLSGITASAFPNIILAKKHKVYSVALIGAGWWGMNILTTALANGSCKAVALCDVDQNQLDKAVEKIKELTGTIPKLYKDYRELLEKEKPEIAIIGTPDHWHALPAIKALQTGCHVYLEKPIAHTINEGKAIVAAQKKYGGVVQVGLHRHVGPHNVAGMEFLKSGKVGDIKMVRAFVDYDYHERRLRPDEEPPKGLDWDMWCGPAPKQNYNPSIHPKGFRNYLDYSNGMCADWGVHWMDQILWWSEEKHPKTVYSTGGVFNEFSRANAPDWQTATFEFESFTAQWEHRRIGGSKSEKHNIGVYFYGTKGTFHMGWLDGWTFYPSSKGGQEVHTDHALHLPDQQNIPELWDDFIKAIETGSKPAADIKNSHYATNMSLLAIMSYKLGRSVKWDGKKQMIIGDDEAKKMMSRKYRKPWEYPKG